MGRVVMDSCYGEGGVVSREVEAPVGGCEEDKGDGGIKDGVVADVIFGLHKGLETNNQNFGRR